MPVPPPNPLPSLDELPSGGFFVVSDYGHGDGCCTGPLDAAAALAEYTSRKFRKTPEQRRVGGLGWGGLTYGKAMQFRDARRRGTHYISEVDRSADFRADW